MQYSENHAKARLAHKTQFREPFLLRNKTCWSSKSERIVTLYTPMEESKDNKEPTAPKDREMSTYQQALLGVCKTSLSTNKQLNFTSKNKVVDGKTVWQTTTIHE